MSIPTEKQAFPLPLRGEFVGNDCWRLTATFEYINGDVHIVIQEKFLTDGASIPRLAQLITGGHWSGKYPKATVPHDFLYWSKLYSRKEADIIFYESMQILGVPFWKRWLMYHNVRMWAWMAWNRHRAND